MAVVSSLNAPEKNTYAFHCLDEVSALVIDIGTSSVRAGYAGDDTPKAIIPSSYGYHPANPETDVAMSENPDHAEPGNKFAKIYIGQSGPSVWRAGMEIGNPVVDGLSTCFVFLRSAQFLFFILLVQDFNPIKELIGHALNKVMKCNPSEHPILVTEPTWNTPYNRERMAEIMFEDFNVPAFYIANTGVLNA